MGRGGGGKMGEGESSSFLKRLYSELLTLDIGYSS